MLPHKVRMCCPVVRMCADIVVMKRGGNFEGIFSCFKRLIVTAKSMKLMVISI